MWWIKCGDVNDMLDQMWRCEKMETLHSEDVDEVVGQIWSCGGSNEGELLDQMWRCAGVETPHCEDVEDNVTQMWKWCLRIWMSLCQMCQYVKCGDGSDRVKLVSK